MNAQTRQNLLDLSPDAAEETLRAFAEAHGEPAYRGTQASRHLWLKPVGSFDEMSELPTAFRTTE